MRDIESTNLPERNPVTYQEYRRETRWQIIVPIVVTLLVLIALAVLAAMGTPGNVSTWMSASVIFLVLPLLFVCLVFLVLFAAMVYGMVLALRAIPKYARTAQDITATVGATVKRVTDAVVEPTLRIESFMAAAREFRDELGGK